MDISPGTGYTGATHFTVGSSPVYFTVFCLISVTCLKTLQTVAPQHGGAF